MIAPCARLSVVAAVVAIVISLAGAALASDEFSPAEQSALTAVVEKGMIEQRQPGVIVGISDSGSRELDHCLRQG